MGKTDTAPVQAEEMRKEAKVILNKLLLGIMKIRVNDPSEGSSIVIPDVDRLVDCIVGAALLECCSMICPPSTEIKRSPSIVNESL
jgi:hypothetical protein